MYKGEDSQSDIIAFLKHLSKYCLLKREGDKLEVSVHIFNCDGACCLPKATKNIYVCQGHFKYHWLC